jgi:hypothetical protein
MSSQAPKPAASWLPHRELGELHKSLASAQDSQIARLVAMVDRLQDRGVVDDLVAPFRPRLAMMRPARPLRFIRLLFTPLDPLIVPAPRWRPGAPCLPRTALPALAQAAHDTMGEEARQIDGMIAAHTTRDVAVIGQAGALLWPCAAQALVRSTVPAAWRQTGLPASVYPAIALNVAAVLDQVLELQTLRAEAELGVPLRFAGLLAMLRQVNAGRPEALGLLIALILARLPEAAPLLRKAGTDIGGAAAAGVRVATEQAKSSLLERLEAEGGAESIVVRADLADAGAEVRRIETLLRGMETDGGSYRTGDIRRRLDAICRTRFASGLQREFLQPLETLAPGADDMAVVRLEEAARGLRELGAEGRRFGSGELYDRLLRQTTDAVKAIPPNDALTASDKVRLVEILAGPDEAWTMLEGATA